MVLTVETEPPVEARLRVAREDDTPRGTMHVGIGLEHDGYYNVLKSIITNT